MEAMDEIARAATHQTLPACLVADEGDQSIRGDLVEITSELGL